MELPWVRILFGWALNSRLFHVLPDRGTQELRTDQVVQDATVAMEHGAKALRELVDLFGVFPIWLCPCLNVSHTAGDSEERRQQRHAALVPLRPHALLLDIGIYGKPKAAGYDALSAHRSMEAMMHACGGFLFSYAISFTTRDEFWERWYDRKAYERFRTVTKAAGAFPDVFDKIGGGAKVAHLASGVEGGRPAKRASRSRSPASRRGA